MKLSGQKTAFWLFLGDIFFLVVALWLTLFFRYVGWPERELFFQHLSAFSFIFVAWLVVFFIFDLYRKPTAIFRRQLPNLILRVQVINTIIAIIFFYYVPIFGITPRTNLFIYLIVSFVLMVSWRTFARSLGGSNRRLNILFACEGGEVEEIKEELRSNPRYNFSIRSLDDLNSLPKDSSLVVIFNPYAEAGRNDRLALYKLIFSGVTFVNVHDLYEEVFDRIPVSILDEQWFLDNISSRSTFVYDLFKRLFDVLVALPLSIFSLIFYPFIILAIKIADNGPVFFKQERVGKDKNIFTIYKFRSMRDEKVTAVGRFLRKTRLDELPQLWSVLRGDLSLIGPRPERPDYAFIYQEEIPYYDIRHLITPGLSGWAQIYGEHAHHATDAGKTTNKLSYDLFYLKNRGIILDLIIGLKTLRILLGTNGI